MENRERLIKMFGVYLLINKGTKKNPEFIKPKRIKGNFRDDAAL